MDNQGSFLDLYDFRRRVFDIYRQRNQDLQDGHDPAHVHDQFRMARDDLFAHHSQTALSPADQDRFVGLDYFPYMAACVEATLDLDVAQDRVLVETSGEQPMPMVRIAKLHFMFDGTPAELSLFWIDVYGGGLFLPFRDATAPEETYGGGRYLFDTVKGSDFLWASAPNGEQRIMLDFNYAYNPSCAYDYRWSCPLAPRENWLPFPIRAGERRYKSPIEQS